MKKFVLLLACVFIITYLNGQNYNSNCTPTCTNQTCPDPENNGEMEPDVLPPSTFGQAYYQKIDILPPPSSQGYQIQWIKIRQIQNLPSGLAWATNAEQLNVGTWYCCEVTGTPNGQVGLFKCDIIVDARVKVGIIWVTMTNQNGGSMPAEVLPAKYNVGGGGSLCSNPNGYAITLSGSNTGTTYTLYRNGVSTGITVAGTGNPISFPVQNQVGTYTVIAKANYDFDPNDTIHITPQPMNGQAIISQNFPSVSLGPDVQIYSNEQITLDAGAGYSSYLWNYNNHTGQTLTLNGSQLNLGNNTIIVNVTNAEGCTASDTVIINVLQALSAEAEIIDFVIPGQVANSLINSNNASVTVYMPQGTNLTNLTPTITLSPGATVNPPSGVAQNFTNPVVYTVTAENNITIKQWTVSVDLITSIENKNDLINLYFDNSSQTIFLKCMDKNISASVYNVSGQLIEQFLMECNQSKSLKHLHPGVYIFKIETESKTHILKLVR